MEAASVSQITASSKPGLIWTVPRLLVHRYLGTGMYIYYNNIIMEMLTDDGGGSVVKVGVIH